MTQNQRHQKALEAAYELGRITGYGKGHTLGFKDGKAVTVAQLEAVFTLGYDKGHQDGSTIRKTTKALEEAYDEGYSEGSADQAAIDEATEPNF